jgi:hypothetical protein
VRQGNQKVTLQGVAIPEKVGRHGVSGTDERQQVVEALLSKHPIFPRATIERLVNGEMDRYKTATVHSFVPVLVQRAVSARLHEADSLPGSSAPDPEALDPQAADRESAHTIL